MGSWAYFRVADYHLFETKYSVLDELTTIFQESDKRVDWIDPETGKRVLYSDVEDPLMEIVYSTPAQVAIDRLNVMGFTFAHVKGKFEEGLAQVIDELQNEADDEGDDFRHASLLGKLRGLSFETYRDTLNYVFSRRVQAWPRPSDSESWIVREVIFPEHGARLEDYAFGFFGDDPRCLTRLFCTFLDAGAVVELDISELVQGGSLDPNDDLCENALRYLTAPHPFNSPPIVLTEGATDREFLFHALQLLFPHLANYYRFLDFDAVRARGGAGNLVSTLKAFAGVALSNRVIAVFDNDTAASDALRSLSEVPLPENIVAVRLPPMDVLRSYPTLGPSGLTHMDVNGMAASIELYFGADVLMGSEGYVPVQWRGYVPEMRAYQGEVMEKARLQDAFREKVKAAQSDPEALANQDWHGMRAIWSAILTAYGE